MSHIPGSIETSITGEAMSSLDLELDGELNNLETQWRQAYEACVNARADFVRVQDCCKANGGLIDVARLRVERAEALKVRLMTKMECAEVRLISGSPS
jgi:hypothetical protein